MKKFICIILALILSFSFAACGKGKGNDDEGKKVVEDNSEVTMFEPDKEVADSLIYLEKDCEAVIANYIQAEAELDAEKLYTLCPQINIDSTMAELGWSEEDIINAMKKEMSYFSLPDSFSYEITAAQKVDSAVVQKYNDYLSENSLYRKVYDENKHKVTEAYIINVACMHKEGDLKSISGRELIVIKENGVWKSAKEYLEFDSFKWWTGFRWKDENDAINNGKSQTTVTDTPDTSADSYTATYQEAIDKYFEAVIDEDPKKFFSLVPQAWIDNITLLAEDDEKVAYNTVGMRLDEHSDNLDMSDCGLTHQIAGYYQVNQDVINEYNEFFSRCYKDSYNKEKHEIDDAYLVKVFWKAEKEDGELVACDMHIFAVIKENGNWKIASEFGDQSFNWNGGNDYQ